MSVSRQVGEALALAAQERLPEVRLLRPQPGDVVVVRLNEDLDEQTIHELNERLSAQFAGTDIRTVVLARGGELEVVRKGDAA